MKRKTQSIKNSKTKNTKSKTVANETCKFYKCQNGTKFKTKRTLIKCEICGDYSCRRESCCGEAGEIFGLCPSCLNHYAGDFSGDVDYESDEKFMKYFNNLDELSKAELDSYSDFYANSFPHSYTGDVIVYLEEEDYF
jgi:hypothetical protein